MEEPILNIEILFHSSGPLAPVKLVSNIQEDIPRIEKENLRTYTCGLGTYQAVGLSSAHTILLAMLQSNLRLLNMRSTHH